MGNNTAVMDYDEINQEDYNNLYTEQQKYEDNLYGFNTRKKIETSIVDSGYNDTKEYKEYNPSRYIKSEDLKLMQNWFMKNQQYRNLMMLNIGCCVGLRESDLLRFRWNMIFDRHGEFLESITIKEQKTSKRKHKERIIVYNETFKKSIKSYMDQINIEFKDLDMSNQGYIARSRKSRIIKNQQGNPIGKTKRLCEDAFSKILRDCAREVGIEYKVSGHSVRKTFARQIYDKTHDVATLQQILNHSSQKETLIYIDVTSENIKSAYECIEFDV